MREVTEVKWSSFHIYPKVPLQIEPDRKVVGQAKVYTRSHCNYTFPHSEKVVGLALDSIPVDLMRKYFLKVRDYMKVYREGLEGGVKVEATVKDYKSHQRVSLFES